MDRLVPKARLSDLCPLGWLEHRTNESEPFPLALIFPIVRLQSQQPPAGHQHTNDTVTPEAPRNSEVVCQEAGERPLHTFQDFSGSLFSKRGEGAAHSCSPFQKPVEPSHPRKGQRQGTLLQLALHTQAAYC